MRRFHTALGLSSFLALAGAALMVPTISNAQTVESSYVACNRDGDCWRVHKIYAYGEERPITYYNSDWYAAHQNDEHIHWRADPADDRGYYVEGEWHPDPGARAVAGGMTGAGVGAALTAALFSFATYQDPRERACIEETESETRRKKEKGTGAPPDMDG